MFTLTYQVPIEQDGRQIKRVIRGAMGVSYQQFSRIKAAGGMLLDGRSVHANQIVREGQRIEITLVEPMSDVEQVDAPVNVVYEDEHLMVIDKIAPLACQASPRHPGDSVENRLAHIFRNEPHFTFRPINRLDKGTSGLMTVAKHAHAQMLLSRGLHTDQLAREYLAVVVGAIEPESGIIDRPIGKADGATVRREVTSGGKPARTEYRTLARANGLSLLRIRLHTGRTHQIRVHMQSMGCPIVGDFLYGAEDARLPRRFALHSAALRLTHPMTGEPMVFGSPLPPEIAALMKTEEEISMRCGCPNCDNSYMVHAESMSLGCVCTQCGARCQDCLGTNSVMTREAIDAMKRMTQVERAEEET